MFLPALNATSSFLMSLAILGSGGYHALINAINLVSDELEHLLLLLLLFQNFLFPLSIFVLSHLPFHFLGYLYFFMLSHSPFMHNTNI